MVYLILGTIILRISSFLVDVFYCVFCRVDIDETLVNGSFSMMFLGHSISLGYRNHINLLMRYFLWSTVLTTFVSSDGRFI